MLTKSKSTKFYLKLILKPPKITKPVIIRTGILLSNSIKSNRLPLNVESIIK